MPDNISNLNGRVHGFRGYFSTFPFGVGFSQEGADEGGLGLIELGLFLLVEGDKFVEDVDLIKIIGR